MCRWPCGWQNPANEGGGFGAKHRAKQVFFMRHLCPVPLATAFGLRPVAFRMGGRCFCYSNLFAPCRGKITQLFGQCPNPNIRRPNPIIPPPPPPQPQSQSKAKIMLGIVLQGGEYGEQKGVEYKVGGGRGSGNKQATVRQRWKRCKERVGFGGWSESVIRRSCPSAESAGCWEGGSFSWIYTAHQFTNKKTSIAHDADQH